MKEGTKQLKFSVEGREMLLLRIDTKPGPARDLTDGEREVASHLRRGYTYREIAARRHTSVHTVANQARSVYRKLGIHSRWQLSSRLAGYEEVPETGK